MPYEPLLLSDVEIAELISNDVELVQLCNRQRESLSSSPSQSGFRVFALIFFETETIPGIHIVEGANSEPTYIGGSICAERAALCKLRMFTNPIVKKVVVTTDSKHVPISPGLLCREYLMSLCDSSTPVVMGDALSEVIINCPLGTLYPFPFLYRGGTRDQICSTGKSFMTVIQSLKSRAPSMLWSEEMAICYNCALEACKNDSVDIHPLKLSAAVQYEDGSHEVAWQLKGFEYGCTLDPICQLIGGMIRSTLKARVLVMVDQFGIAHAPFAQARALLSEHGFGEAPVILVHDRDGNTATTTAGALTPPPPGEGRLLTAKDLNCDSI